MATTGVNIICSSSIINEAYLFQQKLCIPCINAHTNTIQWSSKIMSSDALHSERNMSFKVNFKLDVNISSFDSSLSNLIHNILNQADMLATPAAYVQSSVNIYH